MSVNTNRLEAMALVFNLRRVHSALAAAALLVVSHAAPVAATRPSDAPSGLSTGAARCADSSVLEATTLPREIPPTACSLVGRTIRDGVVAAEVPPPGYGVYVEAITSFGVEDLRIETLPDSTVTLDFAGPHSLATPTSTTGDESSLGIAATPPPACEDEAHDYLYGAESDNHKWYYNRATTPPEVTADAAQTAMVAGTDNIKKGFNDCGGTTDYGINHTFGGNTAKLANIGDDGKCTTRDGQNTVSFGDLPGDATKVVLAVNCNFYARLLFISLPEVAEADVKFNKVEAKWTVTPGSGCTNQFDIEAIMTHERGHTWGLAHVTEADHGNLTMSEFIEGPCQDIERTLGRGDLIGLANKYG